MTTTGDAMGNDGTKSTITPELQSFLLSFQRLGEMAGEARATGNGPTLTDRLTEHLGVDARSIAVITETISPFRVVDADVALAAVVEQNGGADLIGLGIGDERWHATLTELLSRGWPIQLGPVDYTTMPIGPDADRNVVQYGIHLFRYRHEGVEHPVAVLQRGARRQYGAVPHLEVLCSDAAVTKALLDQVRTLMNERSVLRGKVVTFAASEFERMHGGAEGGMLTYVHRPKVPAEAIVLPDGRLDRVRRHVLGIGEHRDALRRAGQHLKRGVLLFGPPGTGKTHTVRHLVSEATDCTVILLAGGTLRLVGLATDTARALQPAIVVLEDCDLVAHERGDQGSPLLFEVLDALDGLASDADVAFLLTTNRADVLEPALAQRPGRVDLAVEIPKPDAAGRIALLSLYAGGLPFSVGALEQAGAAAEGTTASFAKELVRRAVLLAAEAGVEVADAHLAQATRDLLEDTSAITRALLGAGEADGPAPSGSIHFAEARG